MNPGMTGTIPPGGWIVPSWEGAPHHACGIVRELEEVKLLVEGGHLRGWEDAGTRSRRVTGLCWN